MAQHWIQNPDLNRLITDFRHRSVLRAPHNFGAHSVSPSETTIVRLLYIHQVDPGKGHASATSAFYCLHNSR